MFVKLTNLDHRPVWYNSDNILSIEVSQSVNKNVTKLYMGETPKLVLERPDDIVRMIKAQLPLQRL